MALFDRETDPEKERNGVPLDFGDYRVTLARAGGANDKYELELERLLKPVRRLLAVGKLDKAKERELVFTAFARTIVRKWETLARTLKNPPPEIIVNGETSEAWCDGIDLRGTLVPATEANLVAVFTALPGVFLDLQEAAKSDQLFRLEQREDDAGN